jgi:FKBP-type peptidyl-prolyl cis-trans isomerase FklB
MAKRRKPDMKRPEESLIMSRILLAALLFAALFATLSSGGLARASEASDAFFEKNAKKEGVVSLPSGLQYRVLRQGDGDKPRAIDTITLHYRGTTLDGKEVENSHGGQGPSRVRLAKTMPGWREALLLMGKGAKWEVFIPPGLGYTRKRGTRYTRRGDLTSQALIFELELLDVERPGKTPLARLAGSRKRSSASGAHVYAYLMGREPENAASGPAADDAPRSITTESLAAPSPRAAQAAGAEPAGQADPAQTPLTVPPEPDTATSESVTAQPRRPGGPAPAARSPWFDDSEADPAVVPLQAGLKYRLLREGDGAVAALGDTVTVQYRGRLPDGSEFVSSYGRGDPASFRLDEAMPGWQLALQGMRAGGSRDVFIPAELAYARPRPQGDQPLIFEIELLAVSPAEGADAAAVQPHISLPSGMRYRVERNGGGLAPIPGDSVTLEYRVALSEDRGGAGEWHGQATLPLSWVIPAWQSVFKRMEEGARWALQLPEEIAPRLWARTSPGPLDLQVELLSVAASPGRGVALAALESADRDAARVPAVDGEAAAAGISELAQGVQYRELSAGSGARVSGDDTVTLRYSSTLLDASGMGESYFDAGQLKLRPDQTGPLWQQALGRMRQGSRWQVYLGSDQLPAVWAPPGRQDALLQLELLAIDSPPEE